MRLEKFPDVELPEDSNSFRIEEDLKPITEEMNKTSLVVNPETWTKNFKLAENLAIQLTEECVLMTGNETFRPNSTADCAEEFAKRGREVRRTKGGRVSIDKEVLKSFARAGDELATRVIHAREALTKLSQLKAWKPYALVGSVQTTWDSVGTPMGRYTSDSPNLQNRIVEIRETIEPPKGFTFLSIDLKQAEYRVWASMAKDPVLAAAFEGGREFHIEMAKEILESVPNLDTWGDDLKKFGKTTNFAILYGMQPNVLAAQLGTTTEIATRIIKAYEVRASVATEYKRRILEDAKKNERVATGFGRIRYCPGFRDAVWPEVHEISKTAFHHNISGTAAELVKLKTVRTMRALRDAGYGFDDARIGLNVHDEIILMVKDSVLQEVKDLVISEFCRQEEGFIELAYEVKLGKTWLEVSK